jgi:hypothetical protein
MAKSKFFRVAVEGPTVDGRVIERQMLVEAADGYEPDTYTARINCEHIAGYSPDRPFNCYGTVRSLRTEEIELTVNGAKKKLLSLVAEIEANDQLVELNKAGQKLFTSCELHPNFAGEGKAYLVGLAITDTPASLGTEPLKFAVRSRGNLFSSACETVVELDAALDGPALAEATKSGFLAAFTALFKADKGADGLPQPVEPAPASIPAPANDNTLDIARFASLMGEQVALALKPGNAAITALGARLDAIETKLATEESPQTFRRSPATGGNHAIVTDC